MALDSPMSSAAAWVLEEMPHSDADSPHLHPGSVPVSIGADSPPKRCRSAQQACFGAPVEPPPSLAPAVAPALRAVPWLPYSATLALGVASLILLVGFLAWAIPFIRLQNTIEPLGGSIRGMVMSNVRDDMLQRAEAMRSHLGALHRKWAIEGPPLDPFQDANRIGQALQPLLENFPYIGVAPTIVRKGPCGVVASLQRHPTLGWRMSRQNCSHLWIETWDAAASRLTGQVVAWLEPVSLESGYLNYPINMTTLAQPFTWLPLYDPGVGLGQLFMANLALFANDSDVPIGRMGLGFPLSYLNDNLLQQIESLPATQGGRMALFDPTLKVVGTSHGTATGNRITEVGDDDLEAAAHALEVSSRHWCPVTSTEISLSQRYFLDVFLIVDPYPAVIPLQCCAIMLSPRDNTFGEVDRSSYFAIAFVCGMTLGSTVLAVGLGLLVSRPLQQLTHGMHALTQYEFTEAREAATQGAWFREMHSAMDSYRSLVEAMYAFGKYVPHDIVKGLLSGCVRPQLGMTEEHLALCFMDVAGFTTMCETSPASEIVAVTSVLFDRCCEAILKAQGTIDKFIGDCIMCLWGAPVPILHPEGHALQAVLDILYMLREKPIYLRSGGALQLRIGLNAGRCLVGNFGATSRWEYTAIGDVVNTTSRLEALNKQFGTQCLASAAIYDELRHSPEFQWLESHMRPMGDVLLVGKVRA
eukprot:EG_transcript_5224